MYQVGDTGNPSGFAVGDYVYINPSAELDCHMTAWKSINGGYGQIKTVIRDISTPASEGMCAVEFAAPFAGGIDCAGHCLKGQGQWITAKNLDLDFEASRQVHTVPMITCEEYDEKESMP